MELPASFIDYTRALLGDEEYDKLAVAIQQEPPVSIRLNDGKLKIENGKWKIAVGKMVCNIKKHIMPERSIVAVCTI